jgi:hypothetical protein
MIEIKPIIETAVLVGLINEDQMKRGQKISGRTGILG